MATEAFDIWTADNVAHEAGDRPGLPAGWADHAGPGIDVRAWPRSPIPAFPDRVASTNTGSQLCATEARSSGRARSRRRQAYPAALRDAVRRAW
ncbi:hypothetical protein [Micromonospora sp. NPDC001898]|uniref:hypothetical protein n=1 Tax=Micromonospora sp. NPDC001898 TaxID=3364221 RepID=UPI0036804CA9